MEISYLGNGSVRLAGRNIAVVSNPVEGVGKKSLADVSLITTGTSNVASGLVIDSPGEYEVKGLMITGVEAGEGRTAYVLNNDDVSISILGESATDLSTDALEQLSEVDALVVPVGADPAMAVEQVSKIEPKYVVPVGYNKDELSKFLAEMGVTGAEPQAKLKISARDLPEETTVVVLEAQA